MSSASLARAAALALLLPAACSGGDGVFDAGRSTTDDFPEGDAFVFGVALDRTGLSGLRNLAVVITPDDGGALAEEIASPVQARSLTNRRGEFSFGSIAPGGYVLFVRFHEGHQGFGEVVGRVRAERAPSEIRLAPPPVDLRFARPAAGGTLAVADTVVLRFNRFTVAELVTLDPASRPLLARVQLYAEAGAGEGGEGGSPQRPVEFEVPLDEAALDLGIVRVPVEAGGLAGGVRLEATLVLHVVYRDPAAPPPMEREIRATPIRVVRR